MTSPAPSRVRWPQNAALLSTKTAGVIDALTRECIGELTARRSAHPRRRRNAAQDLRTAMRAAALGVRGGVGAADILDGRIAHASIVELLTARHVGTRVMGTVFLS